MTILLRKCRIKKKESKQQQQLQVEMKSGKNIRLFSHSRQNYPSSTQYSEDSINTYFSDLNRLKIEPVCCIGCIQKIEEQTLSFQSNRINTQNYIRIDWQDFSNISILSSNICALLNSGGGFILVYEKQTKPIGYEFNSEKKKQCQSYVQDSLNYIGPKILNNIEVTETSFVPIISQQKNETKHVIRIRVNPYEHMRTFSNDFIYYLNYKGGSGGKKSVAQVYLFDFLREKIKLVDNREVYQLMHKYFDQKLRKNEVERYHEGSPCLAPYQVEQKKNEKKHNISEEGPTRQDLKKFSHSTLFIFANKSAQKLGSKKIHKELLGQKIIFKFIRLFQESIQNHKEESHRSFYVLLHEQASQTIKIVLESLSLKDIQIIKTSPLIEVRDLKVFQQNKAFIQKKLVKKFQNLIERESCFEIITKNQKNYIKFHKIIYGLFVICLLESISSSIRANMVHPSVLDKINKS